MRIKIWTSVDRPLGLCVNQMYDPLLLEGVGGRDENWA